jgi:TM2 domain-containing membrane protein YozV
VVTFDCENGYALKGESTTECQANGWSNTVPTCAEVYQITIEFQCPEDEEAFKLQWNAENGLKKQFEAECYLLLKEFCGDDCSCSANYVFVDTAESQSNVRRTKVQVYELTYNIGNVDLKEKGIEIGKLFKQLNSTGSDILQGSIVQEPELKFNSQKQFSLTQLETNPCILWDMAGKCINGGECIHFSGIPACKCPSPFTGEFCNDKVFENIQLIIIGCVTLVLIAILLVVVFVWWRRNMNKTIVKDYESGHVTMPTIKPAFYPQYREKFSNISE